MNWCRCCSDLHRLRCFYDNRSDDFLGYRDRLWRLGGDRLDGEALSRCCWSKSLWRLHHWRLSLALGWDILACIHLRPKHGTCLMSLIVAFFFFSTRFLLRYHWFRCLCDRFDLRFGLWCGTLWLFLLGLLLDLYDLLCFDRGFSLQFNFWCVIIGFLGLFSDDNLWTSKSLFKIIKKGAVNLDRLILLRLILFFRRLHLLYWLLYRLLFFWFLFRYSFNDGRNFCLFLFFLGSFLL